MLTLDRRFLLMAVAAGLPAVVIALVLLWTGTYSPPYKWGLTIATVALWLGCTYGLRERIARPLRTISSMLAALRENDFSIRARGAGTRDPLSAVLYEVNLLADTMRTQRLDAQEATALLRAVMAEIDVAIFAFDGDQRVVLVNGYGERLLAEPADELIGRTADELGLLAALRADAGIQDITFPGASGRWEARRRKFWQGGQPHEMLVLADVSQPLREQERQAWQRLIRVIGHELNNSLAPIKSIAGSLIALMGHATPPDDWRDDMQRGLSIIGSRADALGRFTTAYAQLADSLIAVVCQRLRFRPELNLRLPECEILRSTHPVKNFIRNRDFFKLPQALETGAGSQSRGHISLSAKAFRICSRAASTSHPLSAWTISRSSAGPTHWWCPR